VNRLPKRVGNGIVVDFCWNRDWTSSGVQQVFNRVRGSDTMETIGVIALLFALCCNNRFLVFVEAARRRSCQLREEHVGRQMVGGQQTTMPLKINMGGVIR
jgi:preprotein translocase subunit SecY